MFVRYPPAKILYEGDRPVTLLGVRVAPSLVVDLSLGSPTTSTRTSRGTWARPCSGWGLPSRPVTRPLVRSYRTVSPLPRAREHRAVRRSVLCGTVLRVAPTGGWPAPCPGRPDFPRSRRTGTAAARPAPCLSLLTRACGPPARWVTCREGPEPALVHDVLLVRRLIVQHRRLALTRVDGGWRSWHGHPAFRLFLSRSLPLGAAAASASRRWRPGQKGVGLATPALSWAGRSPPHGALPQG